MYGEKIKTQREKLGMPQWKLGELLGMSQKAVSQWEVNLTRPKAELLEKMCEIFSIPKSYWYGENPQPVKNDNVTMLIDMLIKNGTIKDPDHIPNEVFEMIKNAAIMDIKKQLEK